MKFSKQKKHPKKPRAIAGEVKIGSGSPLTPKNAKILLVVGLVVLMGVIVILRTQSNNDSTQANLACVNQDGLLAEARSSLVPEEIDALKPIAEKIVALEAYDNDPNCLYVLLRYSIFQNDATNARQYFDKYTVALASTDGLHEDLGSAPESTEALEQDVVVVEKLRDSIKSNAIFYGEVQ